VQATAGGGTAIKNNSPGLINMSGCKIEAKGGSAICNRNTGELNISGGTISSETFIAVDNSFSGKITVSGIADDIFRFPSALAVWKTIGGKNGIYVNYGGLTTGFYSGCRHYDRWIQYCRGGGPVKQ
jgi:hypothetical protein